MLASVSVITIVALTKSKSIVTNPTTRTITSFCRTRSAKNIIPRRAFLLRAIRTTVSSIAFATEVLFGIPRSVVHRAMGAGKNLLSQANATPRAVIGAQCTLTSLSIVIFEANAFSCVAIASPLIRAFDTRVSVIFPTNDFRRPRFSQRACSLGAIMASPCWISVGPVVTSALVWIWFKPIELISFVPCRL